MDTAPVTCSLCGGEVSGETIVGSGQRRFCCVGCKNVAQSLDVEPADPSTGESEPDTQRDECSRLYLYVDGMHNRTCEQFIESIGEDLSGVENAAASYVTETARIDYHDEEIDPETLCDELSTVGYDATRLYTDGTADGTEEGSGHWEATQGIDELLGFRYVAGVVFGTFMLLPYVVVLYPTHIAATFGLSLGRFDAITGVEDAVLLLPLFGTVSGVVLFFTGLPLLRGAYVSVRTRTPNTDLLVTITILSAYVSGLVALLANRLDVYFDLTIVIGATVVAAIFYESLVKQRAVDRLTDLTVSQVAEARRIGPDDTEQIPVGAVEPDDRVLVREGERVPVDGTLENDRCTVDEAVVTGESLPELKRSGDAIVGGSVVTDGAAVVEVGPDATSSIDRITRSVWELQSATHGLQRRVDRLASAIIPAVIAGAAIAGAASLVLGRGALQSFFAFTAAVFVLSPWGLGLATPLSVAANIRDALAVGIVVFDETVFERVRETDVVVFDKTGTLTTGTMEVLDADAPPGLLRTVGALERRATHPAADAIAARYAGESPDTAQTDGGNCRASTEDGSIGNAAIDGFETHALGVSATAEGSEVLVGHPDLFDERGWTLSREIEVEAERARERSHLPVVVGRDGEAEGVVVLDDEPRSEWERTLDLLADRGVDAVILTGDDERSADQFGQHPAVTDVFAGVPPAGKMAAVRALQEAGNHVTMVGDGTNDAPALARSDMGVALGGGTALASDAADVAIADDDLEAVETVFDLATAARRRVLQNTGLALLYNVVVLPFAVTGLLNPFVAMTGVVIAVGLTGLNSTRRLLD